MWTNRASLRTSLSLQVRRPSRGNWAILRGLIKTNSYRIECTSNAFPKAIEWNAETDTPNVFSVQHSHSTQSTMSIQNEMWNVSENSARLNKYTQCHADTSSARFHVCPWPCVCRGRFIGVSLCFGLIFIIKLQRNRSDDSDVRCCLIPLAPLALLLSLFVCVAHRSSIQRCVNLAKLPSIWPIDRIITETNERSERNSWR